MLERNKTRIAYSRTTGQLAGVWPFTHHICTLSLRLATVISARGAFSTACGGTLCQKERVSPRSRTISALQQMHSRSPSPPPSAEALQFAASVLCDDQESQDLAHKRDRSPPSASAAGFGHPPLKVVAETLLPDTTENSMRREVNQGTNAAVCASAVGSVIIQETQEVAAASEAAAAREDEAGAPSDSGSEEENDANAATRAIPQDWTSGDVFHMLPLVVHNISFTSISQRQTEMAPSRSSLNGTRLMQTPHTRSLPATFLGQ